MWVSNKKRHNPNQKRRGFTIVELLIVVVVIAILAAITIVAYNGIQNRAKASAAQQGASQANKKILAFAVDNADSYPSAAGANGIDNLAALGINNSGDTTYQYSSNNTSSPKSFCITATNGNQSYYFSNATSTLTSGACAGHGAGGIAAIANLVPNPKVAQNDAGWLVHFIDGAPMTAAIGTGGPSGNRFMRYTVATAPNATSFAVGFGRPEIGLPVSVTAGKTYNWSMWVRSTRALSSVVLRVRFMNGSAAAGDQYGTYAPIAANSWVRLSVPLQTPTGADSGRILFNASGATPVLQVGDSLDVTMAMASEVSSTPNYADGDSPGWAWTGTPNASTSTGPPN